MATVNIRPEGKAWRLRLRIAGKDHYRYVQGSRGQAEMAAAAWQLEAQHTGAPLASPMTPLRRWMQHQLDTATHLRRNSQLAYQNVIDRHLGALGDRRLKDITPADAHTYKAAMTAAGVGATTCFMAYRQIAHALAAAVLAGVVSVNPFARVRNFSRPEPERPVFDHDEIGELVASAEDHVNPLLELALLLGAETGARRSELVALRWRDLNGTALSINGQLDGPAGELRRVPLKTKASLRTVTLASPDTLVALDVAREAARVNSLAAGVALDDVPILPGADGVSWWAPDTFGKTVALHIRRIGMAGSANTLRHANATVLMSAGVNPREVQRRLGHSSVKMTLAMYTHALPVDDAKAAGVLADAVRKPGRKGVARPQPRRAV